MAVNSYMLLDMPIRRRIKNEVEIALLTGVTGGLATSSRAPWISWNLKGVTVGVPRLVDATWSDESSSMHDRDEHLCCLCTFVKRIKVVAVRATREK